MALTLVIAGNHQQAERWIKERLRADPDAKRRDFISIVGSEALRGMRGCHVVYTGEFYKNAAANSDELRTLRWQGALLSERFEDDVLQGCGETDDPAREYWEQEYEKWYEREGQYEKE